ncbi:MAG TPA: hypothetical protein VGG84_01235 [Gemmatimonadaceae bacterium]
MADLLGSVRGRRWSVAIPVLVSAQESDCIAQSIFDAAFLTEGLSASLTEPAIEIVGDPKNPNQELVVLSGTLSDPDSLLAFVKEWADTMEGNGEPYSSSEEGDALLDRMNGDDMPDSFGGRNLSGGIGTLQPIEPPQSSGVGNHRVMRFFFLRARPPSFGMWQGTRVVGTVSGSPASFAFGIGLLEVADEGQRCENGIDVHVASDIALD